MYIDPELIDYNMHVVTENDIDYWANYGTYSRNYKYSINPGLYNLSIVNDGQVNPKSLSCVYPRTGNSSGHFDIINTTNLPLLESRITEYTLSCWLKLSGYTKTKISIYTSASGGFVYDRGDYNKFRVWHEDTGSAKSTTINKSIVANTWFYFTIEWTNNMVYCYINGEKASSGTWRAFLSSKNPCSRLRIAFHSDTGNNAITAYIDDLIIVRKILWDPSNNFTPPTETLIDLSEKDKNLSIAQNHRMSIFPIIHNTNILKIY